MGVLEVLAAVKAAATALNEARNLYEKVRGTLSESDEDELKKALTELQRENDVMYVDVMNKLGRAAGEGP